MAVRSRGASNSDFLSSTPPSSGAVTVFLRVRLLAYTGDFRGIVSVGGPSIEMHGTGNAFFSIGSPNADTTGSIAILQREYALALTCSGLGTSNLELFVDGVSKATVTDTISSYTELQILNQISSFPLNCAIRDVRVWNALLTAGEIRGEIAARQPQRRANLWIWSPFDAEKQLDISGNAHHWTTSGNIYIEPSPRPPARRVKRARVTDGGTGGGVSHTLVAGAGAFTLTGNAAVFSRARTLVAAQAAFALAGNAAGLVKGRTIAAGAGAFALAGQAAAFTRTRAMVASAGAFALSGNGVIFTRARKLVAGAGVFALTGNAAGLSRARTLVAGLGAFVLTGNAATLTPGHAGGHTLTAGTGAFTLTGNAAVFSRARTLVAAQAAFALAGNAAAFTRARTLVAAQAAFATTGNGVLFARRRVLLAAPGVFVFVGRPVLFVASGAAVFGVVLVSDAPSKDAVVVADVAKAAVAVTDGRHADSVTVSAKTEDGAMSKIYTINNKVVCSGTFTAPAPGVVLFRYHMPSGVEVTYVYGIDAALVFDGGTTYHVDLPATAVGPWSYRFVGQSVGGGIVSAGEGDFLVKGTAFRLP